MPTGQVVQTIDSTVVFFQQILLATDFSEVSQIALAYAAGLARMHHAKLNVVYVLTPEPRTFIPLEPRPKVAQEHEYLRVLDSLQEFVSSIPQQLQHEEILLRGSVWAALDRTIQERAIDLGS